MIYNQEAYISFTNSSLNDDIAVERANAVVMAEAGINLLMLRKNTVKFSSFNISMYSSETVPPIPVQSVPLF